MADDNNFPDLEFDDLPALDFEEYPKTQGLLRGIEGGISGAGAIGSEVLKRNIFPMLAPEVSKSFVEHPVRTAGIMAGGYGALRYPVSSALSYLTRKGLQTPTGVRATDISQNIVKKIPKPLFGFPEPTIGAIGATGQIARSLTPEQYREIPRTAAELLAFKAGERFNAPFKSALAKLPDRLPVPMGKGYKLKRAEQIAQDAEDLRAGIGEQIGEELNQLSPSGGAIKSNLYVDSGIDKDIKINLPKNILDKVKNPIYGVKWIGDKIEKTVGNMHKFRLALADQMTGKDWYEATGQVKNNIRNMFMISGDYMKKTVPELAPLFDEFSGYMRDVYEPVTKVLYRGEQVAERPLRAAIRPGAEESTQKAIEAIGGMSKTSLRALGDLYKYAGRVATRRAIGKVAGTVGKGALLAGGILGTGGTAYVLGRKMKLF